MTEHFNDGIIDLSQFRKQKEEAEDYVRPFFNEPHRFEFEDEEGNPAYYGLMMNIVYNGKQVLVLDELDSETGDVKDSLAIVEGVINNEEFQGIKAIESDEEFKEISDYIAEIVGSMEGGETDEPGKPID